MIAPRTIGARTMRLLSIALAVWAALWIALAAWTAFEVSNLRSLSDTMVKTGKAVDTTGQALQGLGNIPFVGGEVRRLAGQVRAAGQSAAVNGRAARGSVSTLSVLLGVAIGLIPTVPVLALYLPLWVAWRRERRTVANAVRRWGGQPSLEEFLARRALENMPYHELREISENPWRELEDGDRRRLAGAELRRLGLRDDLPAPTR